MFEWNIKHSMIKPTLHSRGPNWYRLQLVEEFGSVDDAGNHNCDHTHHQETAPSFQAFLGKVSPQAHGTKQDGCAHKSSDYTGGSKRNEYGTHAETHQSRKHMQHGTGFTVGGLLHDPTHSKNHHKRCKDHNPFHDTSEQECHKAGT